jgi:hypothetical protein
MMLFEGGRVDMVVIGGDGDGWEVKVWGIA